MHAEPANGGLAGSPAQRKIGQEDERGWGQY